LRPTFGHSGWLRLLLALFFGGGVGAVCAAFAMGAFGRHGEEMAAFFGVGAGFLTTGVYLCRLVGTRVEFPGLRLLASLFVGGGVGLLSAGLGLVMTNDEDTAGFLGAGAGFFTCGLVAWHLFTNVLPGAHARS
jgi:hypothetical protein